VVFASRVSEAVFSSATFQKESSAMLNISRLIAVLVAASLVLLRPTSQAIPRYSDWSVPLNMGALVNSSADDALPTLSRDGRSLYFTSNRSGGMGSFDIWISRRNRSDEPWGIPVNVGSRINSAAADAGAALSRDGHWLFFHSTRAGGMGGFDLMAAWRPHTHDDFGWQTPINLGPAVNSASNDAGPSFVEAGDGDTAQLYFGSDRAGGIGNWDLYVTELRPDGSIAAATLLRELSSPGADQRPAIRRDGLEIFFGSDRRNGVQDIWTSTRGTRFSAWSAPVLVEALSTEFHEGQPALSSDARTMILTSNRPGGYGLTDLYVSMRQR
jgi:Tol biopolymer transport system component